MLKIALAGLVFASMLALAPPAVADVPGIAPFVGSWAGMREGMDISANGTASYHGPATISVTVNGQAGPMMCPMSNANWCGG